MRRKPQNSDTPLNFCAHACRYFFNAYKGGYKDASDVVDLITKLYELDKTFTADTKIDEIQSQRQKYVVLVIDMLFEWAKKQSILPKTGISKAITYFFIIKKGYENMSIRVDYSLIAIP